MGLSINDQIGIRSFLKYNPLVSWITPILRKPKFYLQNRRFSDVQFLKRKFEKYQGYKIDLENPVTLNEKLQWLKLNCREDFHITHADKYAVREYIRAEFGEEYLIPLEFQTQDVRDLTPDRFPDYPVIIKTNHGFGNATIVRDKNLIDWRKLRLDYKRWLGINYYYFEREWQYKDIKPIIIVERLLLDSKGKLPNDYKLNFIEGKLEFIYISFDREGVNTRKIYSANWKPLNFTWARKGKDVSNYGGAIIPSPPTLPKMIEFGTVVAKLYKYVRVDFYDIDGVLYFGEITHCHGGGFDQIRPFELDGEFGRKIDLSKV